MNNPIYQELPTQGQYFSDADERAYFDLRASKRCASELEKLRPNDSKIALKVNLKPALTKKMRLRVWGYSQGKHLYLVTIGGLTMKCNIYSIGKQKVIKS